MIYFVLLLLTYFTSTHSSSELPGMVDPVGPKLRTVVIAGRGHARPGSVYITSSRPPIRIPHGRYASQVPRDVEFRPESPSVERNGDEDEFSAIGSHRRQQSEENQRQAYFGAFLRGDSDAVEQALQAGETFEWLLQDHRFFQGMNPLHIAAYLGYEKIVKLLMLYIPGYLHEIDNDDNTVLHWALQLFDPNKVPFQTDHEKINQKDQIVDYLLNKNPDLSKQNTNGQTPLHRAVMLGNPLIVEKILDLINPESLNIDAQDTAGNTALHLAVQSNAHVIIKLLIKHLANTDITNSAGQRPEDMTENDATKKLLKKQKKKRDGCRCIVM